LYAIEKFLGNVSDHILKRIDIDNHTLDQVFFDNRFAGSSCFQYPGTGMPISLSLRLWPGDTPLLQKYPPMGNAKT